MANTPPRRLIPSKYNAFTLSEVLITLVIIGIIAAITIPLIFHYYQTQALKSALKKNYSVIKQALVRYQIENGVRLSSSDVKDIAGSGQSSICKYFNTIKNGCITYKYVPVGSVVYKNYSGTAYISIYNFDDAQFMLADGSLIMIQNDVWNAGNLGKFYISVDVNGFNKKPNRLGKDLFMFQLMKDGELLPMGAKGTDFYSETDWYCSDISTHNMNGAGCTYKMLKD